MGDGTGIEWADATWNPTVGCSLASPGCSGCFAMRQAARLARMGQERYVGLTQDTKTGPVWTGEVRAAPDQTIYAPLRWSRPRRIFVNSMSDLFHPRVPFGLVMRVWHVMGQCEQHTFQILTKRPDRMRAFLALWADLAGERDEPQLVRGPEQTRAAHPSGRGQLFADMLDAMGEKPPEAAYPPFDWLHGMRWWPAVLPNVWLGTSAEDQVRLDERSGPMQAIADMGWSTWCSGEPLLGALDLSASRGWLRWLVAGGESGPRARPMHPDWARDLRDQCAAAGIPFFFKQWGEYEDAGPAWGPSSGCADDLAGCVFVELSTGDIRRTRELAAGRAQAMRRVGKRRAGDLLDGVQHHGWPA